MKTTSSGSQNPALKLISSRPTGILWLVFRAPVYLYHLGLGRLFGHRFLLFVHQGRKSGLLRETVLEVIRYDPTTRESIVLSGRGEKSDWYRNIEESPALEVRTGHERYVPAQRFLDPVENHEVISEYARRHPLVLRLFAKVFRFGYPLNGTQEERREFARSLRLVAFHPGDETNGCAPSGGRTDASREEVRG